MLQAYSRFTRLANLCRGCLNLAFTLLRQIAENLDNMLAKGLMEHIPAALLNKHNVIFAILFCMA